MIYNNIFYITLLLIFTYKLVSSEHVSYDTELSKKFLFYSKSTFCPKQEIQNWDCIACSHVKDVKDVKVIENQIQGTRAVMGFDAEINLIFLSFRGSDNPQNWYQNSQVTLVDYPHCDGCKAHKGYYNDWLGIQDKIINYYNELKSLHQDAKFVITGHSLGAALATLSSYTFATLGYKVDYMYSFGAPRTGNPALAQYGHSLLPKAIRVTHYRDPVPHFPLQSMGYRGLPTEVWYYDKYDASLYTICNMPGVEEDPECSDSMVNTVWVDHDIYLGMYIGCEDTMPEKQKNNIFKKILKRFE